MSYAFPGQDIPQVFLIDLGVRGFVSLVLLVITLVGLYGWWRRDNATSLSIKVRYGLLVAARLVNLADSCDFYGVIFLPAWFNLFSVDIQTSLDLTVGVLSGISFCTVLAQIGKLHGKAGKFPACVSLFASLTVVVYVCGYTASVIMAVLYHSVSPALGIQRLITGTVLCCNTILFVFVACQVANIIRESGPEISRKLNRVKFTAVLILIVASQQFWTAVEPLLGDPSPQSALSYWPLNPKGPNISNSNLFAVLQDRELVELDSLDYNILGWTLASLMRVLYVPYLIYMCWAPSSVAARGSFSGRRSRTLSVLSAVNGRGNSFSIRRSKTFNILPTGQNRPAGKQSERKPFIRSPSTELASPVALHFDRRPMEDALPCKCAVTIHTHSPSKNVP